MKPELIIVGNGAVGTFLSSRTQTRLISRRDWPNVGKFPSGAFVLVTTKAFHLPDVLPLIAARTDASNPIVLCQNGLGILDEAAALLSGRKLLRLSCWFGARFEQGAEKRVLHVAGVRGVEIAALDSRDHGLAESLAAAFTAADIPPTVLTDARYVEWRKALVNISANGLLALAQAPNGAAADDPHLRPIAETLVDEAVAVARAEGVNLETSDVERVWESHRITRENLNSTLIDLREKRPTEIRWLNLAVARLGERHAIRSPLNLSIGQIVSFLEKKVQ